MKPETIQLPDAPVLAVIDLSERSSECLRSAWEVAKRSRRPLLILHVAHETARTAGMYRRSRARNDTLPILEIARDMLSRFLTDFEAAYPDFKEMERTQLLVPGVPKTRIQEVAERCRAEVIISTEKEPAGLLRYLRDFRNRIGHQSRNPAPQTSARVTA